jgi:hypothetical protein
MAQALGIGGANPFFDPKKAYDVHHREQERRETRLRELRRQQARVLKERQLAGFRAETAGLGRIGPGDQMRGARSAALAGKEADIAEMSLREIESEITRLDREIAQGATQTHQLGIAKRQAEVDEEREKEAVTKAKQAGERQNMLSRFDTVAALLEDYLGENPGTPKAPEIATVVQDLAALEANPDFQQGAALLKAAHSLIRDVDKEMSPYHPFAKRVTEVGKSIGDARKVIDRYNAEQAVLATTAPAAEAAAPAAPQSRIGLSPDSGLNIAKLQRIPTTMDEAQNQNDPLYAKLQGLRESLSREAAMMRGEPIEGGPGASMAEVLQRVAGRDSGPAAAPAGTNPIHIRGVTPPTPTMRAEELPAGVPDDIARGEAYKAGRFFTNVGTGGEIRRVLPAGSKPAGEGPLPIVERPAGQVIKNTQTMRDFFGPKPPNVEETAGIFRPAQEEVTIRPVEPTPEAPAVEAQAQPEQPAKQEMLRVRDRASGKTGSVPANEFDEELYEMIG